MKGPTGSAASRRLRADAGCSAAAAAAAAVDAVPPSVHTQRGCSAPLLRHHGAQDRNRSLSRTARRTSGGATASRTDTHEPTRTAGHGGTGRREDRTAADLRWSLRKRVPHARTPAKTALRVRESCQGRRPTAGITPTTWDRTAWRRRWAKDRQVSEQPRARTHALVMLSGLSSASPRLTR